jgi:hypothetical protein
LLLAVYLASLVEYAVGSAWHFPVGPLVSFAVLLLALRRIAYARAGQPNTEAAIVPPPRVCPRRCGEGFELANHRSVH